MPPNRHSCIHVSLVTTKTKVVPIKHLTMPRLELCGVVIVAKLLSHVAKILNIPTKQLYVWSDSDVVLRWLRDNP